MYVHQLYEEPDIDLMKKIISQQDERGSDSELTSLTLQELEDLGVESGGARF